MGCWCGSVVSVLLMWGLGCELLVLLDACGISVLYVVCCVFGDAMLPVVSLTGVGLKVMFGRLQVLVCEVCGWWVWHVVVVRLVC